MGQSRDHATPHDLTVRLLDGDGHAPARLRRAAFERTELDDHVRTLVDKVALRADQVTDADFDLARQAGLDDDDIWEVVICAAVGQAVRQYDTAVAALETGPRGGRPA